MRSVLYRGFIFLFLASAFVQCKKKSEKSFTINPAFIEKISAFTSGVISAESVIQIILAEDYPQSIEFNTVIETNLFSFKPKIEGDAYWVDKRTIEFRPKSKLKSGETYTAKFFLSKIMSVPSELKTFEFQFTVIPQTFNISIEGFESYSDNNLEWNKVKGSMIAADATDIEELNKITSARQGNRTIKIKWYPAADNRSFSFIIDSVQRSDKPEKIEILWDGSPIGIKSKGKQEIEIPALGDFKVISVKVIHQPEQYLLIQFSDPLRKNQNLEGLIYLENYSSLSYTIEGNTVKVFPEVRQGGTLKLYVKKGVLNVQGFELKQEYSSDVLFEIPKPAVKLVGKGVILPNSKGLIFPFEAVNLNAVDVKIIKIF